MVKIQTALNGREKGPFTGCRLRIPVSRATEGLLRR
jgi:hypothetical protein